MILEKSNYKWYAIYTKANGEKKLFENLQEKNIECFLPTRKVLKNWSDRKKWVEEPLFKCYLFVKVNNKQFFNAVNTAGAVCYVSFGGKAQSIPEIQINNIKTFLSQSEQEVTISYDRIQKGVNVEVVHGSLKGITGEVTDLYGQARLVIRIESMNCSLHVNISREDIRVMDDKKEIKRLTIA
jgi:transcriptional antiterminator RfaH